MKKIIAIAVVLVVSVTACDKISGNAEKTAENTVSIPASAPAPTTMTPEERVAAFNKKFEEIKATMPGYETTSLKVKTSAGKDEEFTVEVAVTPDQQAFGLMLRKEIPKGTGMIFVFDAPKPVEFWMKNTLVHLDMLFVAEDKKIVTIKKNAVPLSEEHIPSGSPVIAVIEVAGGEADRLGIKEGDTVIWEIKK